MLGILEVAFKLLVNYRGNFAALILGIGFAVFLMAQMASIFAEILAKLSSAVIKIGAKIRKMDPAVNTIADSIPMPNYVLDTVRSIKGVNFAAPLY